MGRRLLVYDRTCVGLGGVPGLSAIWKAGARTYRALGRVDDVLGVASWDEAARFVEQATRDEPLLELQYWGHGRFGRVFVDRDLLDASSLDDDKPARFFAVVRERLAPSDRALVWFRTCEAFGARVGLDFASRMADFVGVRVAGHTHVIGFWQSGLHGLEPGGTPGWSPDEGVAEGTSDVPIKGAWSSPLAPRTLHALEGSVPPRWFDGR